MLWATIGALAATTRVLDAPVGALVAGPCRRGAVLTISAMGITACVSRVIVLAPTLASFDGSRRLFDAIRASPAL